ncbi:MAG TPA: hypothetical protein VLC09_19155, partial [Polyangiaceae bacterium]|nr:hypothetical protein [Polyangiaceae bacterium]
SYLLARTTSPLHVKLEPMEYFRKGRFGMQRSVHETWMRVVGNYRLERVDAAPASYVDALEPPSR